VLPERGVHVQGLPSAGRHGKHGPNANKHRVLYRRDKVEQLRNLVQNFSNMSLKDYLDGVIYFFE
jgi:hypothetical protein